MFSYSKKVIHFILSLHMVFAPYSNLFAGNSTPANTITIPSAQSFDLTFTEDQNKSILINKTYIEIDKIIAEVQKITGALIPRDITIENCSSTGCPIDSIQCDAVTELPSCPSGSILNTTRDMCQKDPDVFSCPTGFTYDNMLDKCVKPLECPSGGEYIISRNRCEFKRIYECPVGYTQEGNTCVAPPVCPNNATFDATLLKCTLNPTFQCADAGWTYDPATNKCFYAPPTCQSGGSYNVTYDKCISNALSTTCPSGYTYSQNYKMCISNPNCSAGDYDPITKKCLLSYTPTCATGYTYDSTQLRCEKIPDCPINASYNLTTNRCEQNKNSACLSVGGDWNGNNCSVVSSYDAVLISSAYSCPYGGVLSGKTCLKTSYVSPTCPSGYSLTGDGRCYVTSTCSLSGQLDNNVDVCWLGFSKICSSGTYDATLDKCSLASTCSSSGALNQSTNLCTIAASYGSCSVGYSFDNTLKLCKSAATCSKGILNTSLDRCEQDYIPVCETGWAFNTATQMCEKDPFCVVGTYNKTLNKCTLDFIKSCPSGYSLSTDKTRCELSPSCTSGTIYNPTTNRCEKVITCPAGSTWDATLNSCTVNSACTSPATLNTTTNRCEYTTSSNNCPSGTAFNSSTGLCTAIPTCPSGGVYNTAKNLCTSASTGISCVAGYTYNTTYATCVATPVCSQGTYSATYNVCLTSYTPTCASGYTYVSARDRCEKNPPDCPAGTTYNAITNKCEVSMPKQLTTSSYNANLTTPLKVGANTVSINFNHRSYGNTGHNVNAYTCGSVVALNGQCVDYYGNNGARNGWGWNSNVNMFSIVVPAEIEGTPTIKKDVDLYSGLNKNGGCSMLSWQIESSANECINNQWLVKTFKVGTTEASEPYIENNTCKINLKCYEVTKKPNSGYFVLNGAQTNNISVRTTSGKFYRNNVLFTGPATAGSFGSVYIHTNFDYVGKLPYASCPNSDVLLDGKCYHQSLSESTTLCTNLGGEVSGNTCQLNPTCPSSGSYDGNNDVCFLSYGKSCPSGMGYDSNSNTCIVNAICASRGTLNASIDQCAINGTDNCQSGYGWNSTYSTCTSSPSCVAGTTLNTSTDNCQVSGGYTCSGGFNLSGATCYQAPACTVGTYNTSNKKCDSGSSTSCTGLTLDATKDICYASSSCLSGGNFDTTADKCWFSYSPTCTSGTYDSASSKCVLDAICNEGALNTVLDKCQVPRDVTCAQGVIDPTSGKCTFTATCQNGSTLASSGCNTNEIPLTCPSGTDTVLDVCYSDIDACKIDTSYPPALTSTLTYSNPLNICLIQENVVCATGLTWSEAYVKCEAIPICYHGMYNPENDFCYISTQLCPINPAYPCIGAIGNKWCSPHNCNANTNQCGTAECPAAVMPSSIEMDPNFNATLVYRASDLLCVDSRCDIANSSRFTYCGTEEACPSGFGVYEQNGKCWVMSCPASSYEDNSKCYTLGCPKGTIEQGGDKCLVN